MGHTNSTPNLHLPQFIGSDKPTWLSDVNGAMLAIDTAYGTIEAQASSAATAAAGAVTVANAAQTAADGAASAAATAGTNASQALSTANNAATTANNAETAANNAATTANSALEVTSGKVIAEYTTVGGETWSQAIDALFAELNMADLTPRSTLKLNNSVYVVSVIESASVQFTRATLDSSKVGLTRITAQASGSTFESANVTSGGFSYTNASSDTLGAGSTYRIYK